MLFAANTIPTLKRLALILLGVQGFVYGQTLNRSGADSTIYISHSVFLPCFSFASGEQNWSLTTADMNLDGRPDIISASKLDGGINVHLNDGSGNFRNKRTFPSQPHNRALISFDANGDKAPDIAVVTQLGKLCILLNDGKGALGRPQVLHTGVMAQDLAAGDLNSDGFADLVTVSVTENALKIHLNDGKGRFGAARPVKTGSEPRSVAIGDIDSDGFSDLVTGCDEGRLYFHFGDDKATFLRQTSIRSCRAAWGLDLADLDGNGTLDIAAASYLDTYLAVHLNEGGGQFRHEQEIMSGDHNFDLIISDFDLDGDLDIAACSANDNAVSIHLNEGRGWIGARNEMKSGQWNAGIVAADFDMDGDPDIATSSVNDNNLNIHRNISADKGPEAPPEPHCVSGTVYNDDENKVVSAATISLQDKEERTIDAGVTDAEGKYLFCPKPGTYVMIVRTPGMPVYRETFEMPDADLVKDIHLKKPKMAFVYGNTWDKDSRSPLPAVTLRIADASGRVVAEGKSNAQAAYRFDLPYGEYSIVGSIEGYTDTSATFSLDQSHAKEGRRVDLYLRKAKEAGRCVAGVVRNEKTFKPVPGAAMLVRDSAGTEIRRLRAREDGAYRICLPYGNYQITTRAKGYFFKVTEIGLVPDEAGADLIQDILLTPLEKDATIVLKYIYYDVDKATLRPESLTELNRLLEVMNDNPGMLVEIGGHTDSDASEAHNIDLSRRRAQSVVDYLTSHGVDVLRIRAQGYGEGTPVAPNDTPENKQLNRRTEFRVLALEAQR